MRVWGFRLHSCRGSLGAEAKTEQTTKPFLLVIDGLEAVPRQVSERWKALAFSFGFRVQV